jgi:hypothetical protein
LADQLIKFFRQIGFDVSLDLEKVLAILLAFAFGTLVNRLADRETVVTLFAVIAGKLLAARTWIKRSLFPTAMLFKQHVFTSYAHNLLRWALCNVST